MTDALDQRTIDDFGEQWTKYTENRGYYASIDLLRDVFGLTPKLRPQPQPTAPQRRGLALTCGWSGSGAGL